MDLLRALELTAYSVLRILPYLGLMLFIFRGRLRFPTWVTVSSVVLITALRCLCGYLIYLDREGLSNANPGFLLLVALTVILVKDNWGKSLFSMLMLNNISTFAVIASKYLEWVIFGDYALQLHRWTNLLTLAAVEAAILVPLFFYLKYIYMRAVHQTISKKTWRLLWLVPFTFYTVWYRNSFFATEDHELLSLDPKYVFFCLLINGGAMLIYTLVVYLINERVANDRLREKEVQLMIKQKQFDSLKERIEEARTARHDLRQHLHLISAMLADKRYEELEAYISRYHTSVSESGITYCEHYGVNALIGYFAGLAEEHNIGFSANIEVPADINIPDDVLAVLVGNLLENAIEACMSEKRPIVTIRGKKEDNALFFMFINTFTGQTKKAPNGLYLSTKHEGRGIGLRSVRGIVSDYHGMLRITHENGLFTVSTLLREPYRHE